MSVFITLEGPEGAGKSTLIAALGEKLTEQGRQVLITREPGGTALGVEIRKLLLDAKDSNPDSITELLLFAADRAEHVNKVIKPALQSGKIVICDRFIHSTLAYQGFGRGLSLEIVERLNEIATDGLKPDLVLLLDIDISKGLSRAKGRDDSNQSWNRFEQQEIDFHNRVRAGFLQLAKKSPSSFLTIDASAPAEEVFSRAWKVLDRLLASDGGIRTL